MVILKDMIGKLFYEAKQQVYIYNIECTKCDICQVHAFSPMILFLRLTWKKTKNKAELLCHQCLINNPIINDTFETKALFLRNELPTKAIPYIPSPPVLVNTKNNNQAVYDNVEAEIIDHTKYSGRMNYTFNISESERRQSIPIYEFQQEYIEERDEALNIKEAFSLLDSMKHAKLLDKEGNKILQIENEKKKK